MPSKRRLQWDNGHNFVLMNCKLSPAEHVITARIGCDQTGYVVVARPHVARGQYSLGLTWPQSSENCSGAIAAN